MSAPRRHVQRQEPPPPRPPGPAALSPIPITSRPVRARLDALKAELSGHYQATLGRDATWNEVMARLLAVHDAAQSEVPE